MKVFSLFNFYTAFGEKIGVHIEQKLVVPQHNHLLATGHDLTVKCMARSLISVNAVYAPR